MRDHSMPSRREAAFEDWVADARAFDIVEAAYERGAKLKRSGAEMVGPCPTCGGTDCFAIHLQKKIFNCRKGGQGGDVIAMVEHLDSCDFKAACTALAGKPPPRGGSGQVDEAERARRAEEAQRRSAEAEREEIDYRERERRAAWDIWQAGRSPVHTDVDDYMRGRGLPLPPHGVIRFHEDLPFWLEGKTIIHRGSAMLAAITNDQGRFAGVHMTWIDPAQPGSKARLLNPTTGELLPAKKVRGSKRRAAIKLATNSSEPIVRLVAGEGIETVQSVFTAELGQPQPPTAYWSTIDLGHLGGKAAEAVAHPTATRTDRRGRIMPLRVPGPEPLIEPDRDLMPPEGVREIVLLGDGDSDRFLTEMALKRAAARWSWPGRTIRIAWAPQGRDFNDVLRGAQ